MYTVDTLCLAVPPQVTAAFKVRVEVLQAELAKVEESAAKAYISIPISPRILFVAAHNHDMADALRAAQPTEVVRKNNQRVIEQARKFVWGCTDSQLTFVQKHFGKLPDRELLTNQQRQEAIEAPRAREKKPLERHAACLREITRLLRPSASRLRKCRLRHRH